MGSDTRDFHTLKMRTINRLIDNKNLYISSSSEFAFLKNSSPFSYVPDTSERFTLTLLDSFYSLGFSFCLSFLSIHFCFLFSSATNTTNRRIKRRMNMNIFCCLSFSHNHKGNNQNFQDKYLIYTVEN